MIAPLKLMLPALALAALCLASAPQTLHAADTTSAAAPAASTKTIDFKFGKAVVPTSIRPGETYDVTFELDEQYKDLEVRADLHFLKAQSWGGWLASGSRPQQTASGAHRITLTAPTEKADQVKTYLIYVFVSPDGDHKKKTADDNIKVPIDNS